MVNGNKVTLLSTAFSSQLSLTLDSMRFLKPHSSEGSPFYTQSIAIPSSDTFTSLKYQILWLWTIIIMHKATEQVYIFRGLSG
jgi:hypothetical protein